MTKYENIHKMILTTILLESNLKVYKSAMLHEMKLQELAKIDKVNPNSKKHEHELRLIRRTIETEFKKRIERCEKYNGETLRDFLQINPKDVGLDIFIENSHDLIADFISLFIKSVEGVTKEKPVKVVASLLHESEKANIFLNGKKYLILTKK